MIPQSVRITSTWSKPHLVAETSRGVETFTSKRQVIGESMIDTHPLSPIESPDTFVRQIHDIGTRGANLAEVDVPAITPYKSVQEGALAKVIQIWEGTVLSVDHQRAVMTVKLTDRNDQIVDHTADIELQWVDDQDRDLLRDGAVFYWTLFKETKRGSVRNTEKIRFRRLPSWNKAQLDAIKEDATKLSAKFSTTNRIAD